MKIRADHPYLKNGKWVIESGIYVDHQTDTEYPMIGSSTVMIKYNAWYIIGSMEVNGNTYENIYTINPPRNDDVIVVTWRSWNPTLGELGGYLLIGNHTLMLDMKIKQPLITADPTITSAESLTKLSDDRYSVLGLLQNKDNILSYWEGILVKKEK